MSLQWLYYSYQVNDYTEISHVEMDILLWLN